MPVAEPVWYADSEDPYHTLRHSGGCMVGIALVPVALVLCAVGNQSAGGRAWILLAASVPAIIAAVLAAWEYLRDRRAVVEMRLTDSGLTVLRVDRTMSTYPLASIRRVEVTRRIGARRDWSSLRLHLDDGLERTRPGPPDLPDRWVDALTAAEVDLQIREVREMD